jgi:carboxypeptidase Taq
MRAYAALNEAVAEINDLMNAISILNWDARTQMPAGGTLTRGQQLATLSAIAQERLASDRLQTLLEAAEAEVASQPADGLERRGVEAVRQAADLFRRIPAALTRELAQLRTTAQQSWAEARAQQNFSLFAADLERMFALNRELAAIMGYQEHPYDAMVDLYEPGMTASKLRQLFAGLRQTLVPMVRAIANAAAPRTDFLFRTYPVEMQRDFALKVAHSFGLDPQRSRLDASLHPFEVSFTRQDVRITTRYRENFLNPALFGVFHETGHALYEQNVDPALTRSALTSDLRNLYAVGGTSFGAHESQARLWENLIGRSRWFWNHWFGQLQQTFPQSLADVDVEAFYRGVNAVQPSLIRVEADEVTYNLHIMLRVEVEMGLMDGSIAVRDLPEVWNQKINDYLGVTPPNDAVGVLQDIHWSHGNIGSFPAYTIGNLMGAQLMETAHQQVAGLQESLNQGDYQPLLHWLTETVYRHGRRYTVDELLAQTTGQPLQSQAFERYITQKFSALYGV